MNVEVKGPRCADDHIRVIGAEIGRQRDCGKLGLYSAGRSWHDRGGCRMSSMNVVSLGEVWLGHVGMTFECDVGLQSCSALNPDKNYGI